MPTNTDSSTAGGGLTLTGLDRSTGLCASTHMLNYVTVCKF